ncbi:hypothetical protein DYB32_008737 [Aphanomyces invadans]|uniref:Protein kinase domain-containing protein n=1 Tax=Aphanomyces invadans TaxID=157072 RepID=A0A3R6VRL4_9STRA|nr:hypothetical protein DYB32_008737 [Aphanomyces invadans]
MTFASCSATQNTSEPIQVLPCVDESVITFPPSTIAPSTTEASINTPRITTTAPSPTTGTTTSISATTKSLLSILGGVLAIALVSFSIVHHRRRRLHLSKGVLHDDALNSLDDDEGAAYMTMSPKRQLPPAAPLHEQPHSPTSPTFLEYLDSVDAFRSLWLPMAGVRLVPVKGSSHGLVAATVHGTKHVLKGIDYTTSNATNLFLFGRAVQLVLALSAHKNLTRITGVARIHATRQFAVATEFLNKGSLGHYAVLSVPAPDVRVQRLRLCADVAAALAHLHAIGCVYGMLHPEKILLQEEAEQGTLVAKLNLLAMMDQAFVEVPLCPHHVGSMRMPYVAPESRHEAKTSTAAGDVYALGVIIGQLLSGRMPFEATYHDLGWVRGDVYLATHPQVVPFDLQKTEALCELLHACWSVDPSARPSAAAVLTELVRIMHAE